MERPPVDALDSTGNAADQLEGLHVAFVGKLGGMTRREAFKLVRDGSGFPQEAPDELTDLIVVGADELPLDDPDALLSDDSRQAVAQQRCQIVSETQFWQQLGWVEHESHIRKLYTPAMLAQLLDVTVATIRRWHRRGLIVPVREVRRLPYFDFQEVATARRIGGLIASGASPAAIERKLARLAELVPGVDRPLAQLNVIVEGRDILLRQGEGLVEPGGQLRIDFEALEREVADHPPTLSFPAESTLVSQATDLHQQASPAEMSQLAAELEDAGQLGDAIEVLRTMMIAFGPRADVCFQLAELLYRIGNLQAACERYFMAIELDEDYVEARANLGCVLAETGQFGLAVAAFRGALRYHADYPDAHFHLARTLDEMGCPDEAIASWRRFLSLAPDSPWADEARQRLGLESEA